MIIKLEDIVEDRSIRRKATEYFFQKPGQTPHKQIFRLWPFVTSYSLLGNQPYLSDGAYKKDYNLLNPLQPPHRYTD